MSMTRWSPVQELISLNDSMDRFMDIALHRLTNVPLADDLFDGRRAAWIMPMDAHMTDDAVVIEANVPGVKPEDLSVTLEGNTLTLRGEIKSDKRDWKHLFRERVVGKFERTITINTPIDGTQVTAEFENGVVTLTLPKVEEAKPRHIEIKPKTTITAHSTN